MAKPKMRRIRGEYRPIFEALLTGKDFNVLSPDGKLAFIYVKGLGGASGIRVWPAFHEQLAELTGIPTPRMKRAIAELCEAGWLDVEGSVVWVVRGLEFEPQMCATNEKHRTWLRDHLESLPRVALLDRFRAAYSEWFAARDEEGQSHGPSDSHADSLSDTNPKPVSQANSQSLSLSPATAVVTVAAADGQHRTRLAVAANKGIAELFGEQPNPLRWDQKGTHEFAAELQSAGVDLTFAEWTLYCIASSKTPSDGRPPRTLKYYATAVVDAWRAEEMQRVVATSPTPTSSGPAEVFTFDDLRSRIQRGELIVNG